MLIKLFMEETIAFDPTHAVWSVNIGLAIILLAVMLIIIKILQTD